MYSSEHISQHHNRPHLYILQPAASTALPIRALQPKSATPTASRSRRRGVVLTQSGWQKLLQANVIYNEYSERHSFEYLSSQVMLDPRTVCRIVDREIGVDKRTLDTFFTAFHLKLEKSDYITLATHERETYLSKGQNSSPSLSHPYEEIVQIKQRIINNAHRLAMLLGIDHSNETTLSVKLSPQAQPLLEIRSQLY